jgi:glycosyltransferase involved in cell wall biosynthesis
MSSVPRLSVALPVYNGQNFLSESIEALLGQTFEDFELIISDNASSDATEEICHAYEKQDPRIRYFRQPRNIGLAPNHTFTLDVARGELFKWAAHDDLYAKDLLKLCVEALDEHAEVVLAHSWTARIDGEGKVLKLDTYPLETASPDAPVRFRSMLYGDGGDDDGGVIRTEVLRRTGPRGSHYHADRTLVSELVLFGPFYQVPQWLFFRRDHPERAQRKFRKARDWCANMDPRRGNARLNPAARLYAEYIWAYVSAIHRSPLTAAERRACYLHLAGWVSHHAWPGHGTSEPTGDAPASIDAPDVNSLVPGREKWS